MTEISKQNKSQLVDTTNKVPCPFDENFLRLVQYLCSCGHLQPICRLYFCRYCSDLRCGQCVSHEVDSHYCPNCLENMPSAEARLKKNRCANCFDCPSCGHTLSTRATSMTVAPQVEGVDGQPAKPLTKKTYFLECFFCHWSTRQSSIPCKASPRWGLIEPENVNRERFDSLLHYYKSETEIEKHEQEKRKNLGKRLSYIHLAEKYGLRNLMQKSKTCEERIQIVASKACSIDEVEVIHADALLLDMDLSKQTNLQQRIRLPQTQPPISSELQPISKTVIVKTIKRCRECEHILSKQDYKGSSSKHQINLSAFDCLPNLTVSHFTDRKLVSGEEVHFILHVRNRSNIPTYVEILEYEDLIPNTFGNTDKTQNIMEQSIAKYDGNQISSKKSESSLGSKYIAGSQSQSSFPLKASMLAAKYKTYANAKFLSLTQDSKIVNEAERVKTYLPARDDAAEFDDHDRDFPSGIVDDKRIVAWRKSNKVGIKAKAKLNCDLERGDEVITGFALRFLYTNTVPSLEQREIQTSEVTIPVFVVLGTCEA